MKKLRFHKKQVCVFDYRDIIIYYVNIAASLLVE